MSEMDRRTFLLRTGRWLAIAGLAGLAPLIPGCAGAATTTSTASEDAATTTAAAGGTATSAAAGAVGTTSAVGSGSTAASPGGATTSTGGPTSSTSSSTSSTGGASAGAIPDLVVVKGEVVENNLRAAIALLGGMERFVKKGGKVVVKPNVLTGRPPEYATTTSPELMTAVIKMCQEVDAKEVVVFDSPTSSDRAAFQVSGLDKAVSDAGGKLIYLSSRGYQTYDIPQGKLLKSWDFVTQALTADTLINLALPKQHSVSGATMTMKNLMGIMGGRRGQIHIDFDQKIVDVNTLVKPTLAILDAYRVLFRNGPTGGSLDDVRLAKTLVAGTNQVCIDAYGAQFLDMKPTDLPWLVEANKRGMGDIDLSKLKIATANA
jgi:uncharacterized protein (DUF362 family)